MEDYTRCSKCGGGKDSEGWCSNYCTEETGARTHSQFANREWEMQADRQALDDRLRRLICDGDVERFITDHGLGPVGRGRGRGRGQNDRLTYILCPLHSEKSGSFVFFAAHTTKTGEVHCHCFGCQWTGDLVALAAELRGITRAELVEDPVRWGR